MIESSEPSVSVTIARLLDDVVNCAEEWASTSQSLGHPLGGYAARFNADRDEKAFRESVTALRVELSAALSRVRELESENEILIGRLLPWQSAVLALLDHDGPESREVAGILRANPDITFMNEFVARRVRAEAAEALLREAVADPNSSLTLDWIERASALLLCGELPNVSGYAPCDRPPHDDGIHSHPQVKVKA